MGFLSCKSLKHRRYYVCPVCLVTSLLIFFVSQVSFWKKIFFYFLSDNTDATDIIIHRPSFIFKHRT